MKCNDNLFHTTKNISGGYGTFLTFRHNIADDLEVFLFIGGR